MTRFLICIACGIIALASAATAQNNNWPKAIAAVSQKAEAYTAFGLRKTNSTSVQQAIGMIGLTLHVERHRCAILGRMLGKIDEIAAIEQFDMPPINDALDGFEAMEIGSSLSNWVGEARRALEADEAERVNVWNLDCAGHFDIPVTARLGSAAPEAQFDFDAGGKILFVYGDIDSGFADRFDAALAQWPDVAAVALGSGGGSVKDAILAGQTIRARGLTTRLHGNCYSACPLVFAGGVERTLWADVRHDFGFHRLSTRDGTTLPDDHAFYDLIADYVSEMGVNPDIYVGWMHAAAPDDMFHPEPHALCEPVLATFVQRICLDGKRF